MRLEEICKRHDVSLKAAALRFPLFHPAVASVLVGCHSPAEVDGNCVAFAESIPSDLWSELKAEGLIPSFAPTP